jgi:DNA-binding MarR family transcriptional regulator
MAVRRRVKPRAISAAEAAAVGVMSAAGHVQQTFADICERHGITGDQYGILRALREAHPTGRARGEVAGCCVHRAPDVTRMIDRLVRQGLVRRTRDNDDRRCSLATITSAGLKLLARIDPEIAAAARRLTQSLSTAQLQQLARLTGALAD